jgi:hypothetical protein
METQIDSGMAGMAAVFGIVYLAIGILMIVSWWKILTKAGKPGWAILIPIYNIIVILQVVQKPVWWIILLIVPFANIVVLFIMIFGLAKVFGKGAGFGFGLLFLSIIFIPVLAFGDAQYQAAPATQQ